MIGSLSLSFKGEPTGLPSRAAAGALSVRRSGSLDAEPSSGGNLSTNLGGSSPGGFGGFVSLAAAAREADERTSRSRERPNSMERPSSVSERTPFCLFRLKSI